MKMLQRVLRSFWLQILTLAIGLAIVSDLIQIAVALVAVVGLTAAVGLAAFVLGCVVTTAIHHARATTF